MFTRKNTKSIKVGNVTIGGKNEVVIQSMCNIKTSNYLAVAEQINECAALGAQIMRVSILDFEDAKAIKEIKKLINIPLVADIHFNYKFAIEAINSGADSIRINPGNIGSLENIKKVVELCKEKNIPIRVGVNSGSMDSEIYNHSAKLVAADMVNSIKKHVTILENLDFHNIILSLKSSNPLVTIEAYKQIAEIYDYPLHIGITEAGIKDISLVRSSSALGILLYLGLGDTIRISITGDPKDEIIACKRLLHDFNLYDNYYTLISCPTCGRTCVDLTKLTNQIVEYLELHNKKITVALMGCVVNGPGEAKEADIGIAGGKENYAIFKKGIVIKTIPESEAYNELIKEIESF